MQSDFNDFSILKEKMHELTRLNHIEEQLSSTAKQQEKQIITLQVELDMEQEDVAKLTKMTLSNLFYTILRSKEEQLNKERRDVLEATLLLQEAMRNFDDYRIELNDIRSRIAELSSIPGKYDELMRKKEMLLRSMPASAHQLEEMESEIANQSLLLKELKEALREGKGVQSLLTDASGSLGEAEDWGNWDLWLNGGAISTHVKHGHIDDARSFIHSANRQMERFQKELADLKKSVNIQVDISEILTLADYLFDGLIVDWIVQGKIENAQYKTRNALHKVRPIITQLEKEARSVEKQVEELKQQRISWIEREM